MSVDNIINNYNETVKQIDKLNDEAKKEIYRETSELIEYYENMTSKAEDKRGSIHGSAVKSLNLIVAFLTLVITINVSNTALLPYFIPIYVFASISLINALTIMSVYWMQSSCKYVSKDTRLTEYGNYWKRFYYGNKEILKISTSLKKNYFKVSGKNQNNAFDEASVEAYLCGLDFMVTKYVKETLNEKVENNIKQLYLMQVLNYYKNRYNMFLTSINNYFTVIKIVSVVLSIIAVLIFYC